MQGSDNAVPAVLYTAIATSVATYTLFGNGASPRLGRRTAGATCTRGAIWGSALTVSAVTAIVGAGVLVCLRDNARTRAQVAHLDATLATAHEENRKEHDSILHIEEYVADAVVKALNNMPGDELAPRRRSN
jgi:hypothetical protein